MKRRRSLKLKELIAIAIGGMVGGGIFTILGISVSMVGFLAPFAIAIGGVVALFASYAYVKLGVYYKDEGATYAFFKRTFQNSHLAAAFIGWYTVWGYISTLALYSYTFSSYAISGFDFANNELVRKGIAILILWVFALVNIWSVRGMGDIEDVMVYIKLGILLVVSILLMHFSNIDLQTVLKTAVNDFRRASFINILTVSSITFVAYEGFQLVIHAVNDMKNPDKNIPRAIYSAVAIVIFLYFIIALGAVVSIPASDLIKYKEYALATGAKYLLGNAGQDIVISAAVLATLSAINGTMYGSSRLMARIADDHYFPSFLSKRRGTIPINAITIMASMASLLVIIGGLRLILEFGSIMFLLVSMLTAIANYKIRGKTNSSAFVGAISIFTLAVCSLFILGYEYQTNPYQMVFIVFIYLSLSLGAFTYSRIASKLSL